MKNWFRIEEHDSDGYSDRFRVRLNPDCRVYEGHFPGKPVSPGVCNIDMVRECAQIMAQEKLTITEIPLCRMNVLITPDTHPVLDVFIRLSFDAREGSYVLDADIKDGETVCLHMKANLTEDIGE